MVTGPGELVRGAEQRVACLEHRAVTPCSLLARASSGVSTQAAITPRDCSLAVPFQTRRRTQGQINQLEGFLRPCVRGAAKAP